MVDERAIDLDRDAAVSLAGRLRSVPFIRRLQGLLLSGLVEIFCRSLSDAYDHIDALSLHDTLSRLIKVLLKLAAEMGRPAEDRVEIDAYLTQDEIAQFVAGSRERVSTALNILRREDIVEYSRGGHLIVDTKALELYRRDRSS